MKAGKLAVLAGRICLVVLGICLVSYNLAMFPLAVFARMDTSRELPAFLRIDAVLSSFLAFGALLISFYKKVRWLRSAVIAGALGSAMFCILGGLHSWQWRVRTHASERIRARQEANGDYEK